MGVRVYFYNDNKVAHVASSMEAAIRWITDQAPYHIFSTWNEGDRTVYDVGALYFIYNF